MSTRPSRPSHQSPISERERPSSKPQGVFFTTWKKIVIFWGPPRIHYTHVYPCIKICSTVIYTYIQYIHVNIHVHTVYYLFPSWMWVGIIRMFTKHDPYLEKEHEFSQTFAKHPIFDFHHSLISRIFRMCLFWKSWLCSPHPRWLKKNPTTLGGGFRGNAPSMTWQIAGWWTHSAEGKVIVFRVHWLSKLINLSNYNWVRWAAEEVFPVLTGVVQ